MDSAAFYNKYLLREPELKIADTHKLIRLAQATEDKELKRKYLNEAVIGTLPVLIKYVKRNKLNMFKGKYYDEDDMLNTMIEVWTEKIYSGDLLNYEHFSFVFNDRFLKDVSARLLGFEVPVYDYFGVATKVFVEMFSNYTYMRNKGENPTKEKIEEKIKDVDSTAKVSDFLLGRFNSIYNKLNIKDISDIERIKSKTRYFLQIFINLGLDEDIEDGLVQTYNMEDEIIRKDNLAEFASYIDGKIPSERDKKIMGMRFGFGDEEPMTFNKISRLTNYSRNGVRLMVKKAIEGLKEEEKVKTYYYK